MKHRPAPTDPWPAKAGDDVVRWLVCRLAIALVVALAFSPVIRRVTAGLTQTVGTQWPFALEHCRALDTPGCHWAEPDPLIRHVAAR